MADGCRPEVAGGITSGKIYASVVVNLCTKFGDSRTSSSLSAKIFFFKMASADESLRHVLREYARGSVGQSYRVW